MKMNLEQMTVQTFRTSQGAEIYQLPLEVFPGMWGYAYLILFEDYRVLIDTGSGIGNSNPTLEEGFRAANELIVQDSHWRSEPVDFADLTHILITHGHIDHFGGLAYLTERTPAKIGIHELDRANLTHYEERLALAARRLDEYLTEAGISPDGREKLMDLYKINKALFHSVRVDFSFEAIGMQLGPFEMLHVPGHCPGEVVIRLHDILFSGDHVLEDTSPHQSPEQLALWAGLGHYLKSLESLRQWAGDIRMSLGGHKQPILDLNIRMATIEALHHERLQKVLEVLRQPKTIKEVSQELFPNVNGYNVLLALEEAGAHVEYLYQRGFLEIANLDELESASGPVPLRYRCIECRLE